MTDPVTTSFQQTLFLTTWYGVEFICYICIIAYVAAFFNFIKSPRQTANVVENTAQTWGATSDLIANAASIARQVNGAISGTQQTAAPAAQAPK